MTNDKNLPMYSFNSFINFINIITILKHKP